MRKLVLSMLILYAAYIMQSNTSYAADIEIGSGSGSYTTTASDKGSNYTNLIIDFSKDIKNNEYHNISTSVSVLTSQQSTLSLRMYNDMGSSTPVTYNKSIPANSQTLVTIYNIESSGGTSYSHNTRLGYTIIPNNADKANSIQISAKVLYNDQVRPSTPILNGPAGFSQQGKFTINGSVDDMSDVQYYYTVDYGDEVPYTGEVTLPNGATSITAYTRDQAGNTSEEVTEVYYIDNMVPPLPDMTTAYVPNTWTNQDVKMVFGVATPYPIFGYKGISYGSTGAQNQPFGPTGNTGLTRTISLEGITQISYSAVTATDMSSIIANMFIKIDKTAPPPPTIQIK